MYVCLYKIDININIYIYTFETTAHINTSAHGNPSTHLCCWKNALPFRFSLAQSERQYEPQNLESLECDFQPPKTIDAPHIPKTNIQNKLDDGETNNFTGEVGKVHDKPHILINHMHHTFTYFYNVYTSIFPGDVQGMIASAYTTSLRVSNITQTGECEYAQHGG